VDGPHVRLGFAAADADHLDQPDRRALRLTVPSSRPVLDARQTTDKAANLLAFPGIFPDQLAPIVRNNPDGERELVMASMPGPTKTSARLLRC